MNLNGNAPQQGIVALIRLEEDDFSVEQAKAFEAEYNDMLNQGKRDHLQAGNRGRSVWAWTRNTPISA